MIEKSASVRPVKIGDEDKLFSLLALAHSENAPYIMSERKVRNFIHDAACDREIIIGVIDAPDGSIAGSIGAIFSQFWYTDDWHIEECWNYVHPDHRHSKHAKDLIHYIKWIAENMNMPAHIGIMTATRMEAKIKFYQRQMPQVGAAFAYNMKSASGPIAERLSHER